VGRLALWEFAWSVFWRVIIFFRCLTLFLNILPGSLLAALLFLLCKVSQASALQVPVAGSLLPHKILESFRFFFSTGGKGQGQNKKWLSEILLVIHTIYTAQAKC